MGIGFDLSIFPKTEMVAVEVICLDNGRFTVVKVGVGFCRQWFQLELDSVDRFVKVRVGVGCSELIDLLWQQ